MSRGPAIDVVVPSYRRPQSLARCLGALADQRVMAARVVVVARGDDRETLDLLARCDLATLRVATVAAPGVVAALRVGVGETTADVVAFTDDDARPRRDWVGDLSSWFARSDVGAVGGRDVQDGCDADASKVIGRLFTWGRMTGQHHVGAGAPQDVDVLKGVNVAVRAEALALARDGLLEGAATDPHYEVLMTDFVRRAGWRVVYDPDIVVDHDVAPRVETTRLDAASDDPAAVFATAANRIISATVLDRRRLVAQLGYGLLIGTRESPGLARAAVGASRHEAEVVRRLRPSLRGQIAGARRVISWREPAVVTCAELRASS